MYSFKDLPEHIRKQLAETPPLRDDMETIVRFLLAQRVA